MAAQSIISATCLSDVSAPARLASSSLDPLPGAPFRVLRRMGAGRSSEVYEARSDRGERRVVKVLRSAFLDAPDVIRRLASEARALSLVHHPNVVRVIEVGTTTDGRPYWVMPYVSGETLRQRLTRSGHVSSLFACAIVRDALEGLSAVHQAGLIHRDVKPQNLFLPRVVPPGAGSAKCLLLDSGLASVHGARSTEGSFFTGAPGYLAPEQILAGKTDERTDVYAMGITLFESIAGRGPFEASSPLDLVRAHLDAQPIRLRAVADVSVELDHAIARAISKAPARRWPSASAFAAVLERAYACELARKRRALARTAPAAVAVTAEAA